MAEATYDFGDAYTDADAFLATAAALENTGVSAYDGAGQFLADPELLTAAGSIVAVEARHASYLNLITGEVPFPAAFETPADAGRGPRDRRPVHRLLAGAPGAGHTETGCSRLDGAAIRAPRMAGAPTRYGDEPLARCNGADDVRDTRSTSSTTR